MAILKYDDYAVKITPRRLGGSCEFVFEFTYKNEPLYNPNILEVGSVVASEYEEGSFLDFFKKVSTASGLSESYIWTGWDEEVEISSKFVAYFEEQGKESEDDYTDLEFSFQTSFFKGAKNIVSLKVPSIKFHPSREELLNFTKELELEINSKNK